MIRRAWREFLLALEFLTILRFRRSVTYNPAGIGGSLAWFPLVGLLIGGLLVAVDAAGSWLFPVYLIPALVIAANAVITGALHLDGLADTADGLFGGHTPERRLEIMRDSRTGTFGVVAVVLVLLLSYASLLSMTDVSRRAILLVAPVISRMMMVVAILRFPYARPSGLGRAFKDNPPHGWLVTLGVLVLAVSLVGVVWFWVLLSIAGLGLVLLAGWFVSRRLGGLTGDVYGAAGVLIEVALFLVVATDTEHPWVDRLLGW
ncbi:MAG: adenosylcobinamide-GDP ribazoletransferase [Dehalococcoidia bacterium]